MIYGDVCTGVSAASVAYAPLGWQAAWFSEIEPFPCKVLKYHYPHVPNLGNMMELHNNKNFINVSIDLLVGGTPCQSFSVAGLREGLASSNGNLALEFCRILKTKQPRWFKWENVPGALSSYSNEAGSPDLEGIGFGHAEDIVETADFAAILTAFRECGYSCAWRVLDAQYFGVPQRRRRIFVVGYLGNDWRPAAAVLFDGESLSGNTEKGRKKREGVTGTLTAGAKGRSPGVNEAGGQLLPIAFQSSQSGVRLSKTHATLDANNGPRRHNGVLLPCWWDGGQVSQTLDRVLSKGQTMPEKNRFPAVLCYPYNQITSPVNRSNPANGDPSPTLGKRECAPLLVPYTLHGTDGTTSIVSPTDLHSTLRARTLGMIENSTTTILQHGISVRRLTPLECERLQGFPDNYTNIPGASNTARYQAIGNSMAVPVMHWLAKRIDIVDKFLQSGGI